MAMGTPTYLGGELMPGSPNTQSSTSQNVFANLITPAPEPNPLPGPEWPFCKYLQVPFFDDARSGRCVTVTRYTPLPLRA